jgi:membrane-associated protease RseP (regulator of RpoE activity)
MGSRTGIGEGIIGSLALPRPEAYGEALGSLRPFRMPDTPQIFTTWRSSVLGIEAESLNEQLAEYFGVEDGVLVRSVGGDTAAEAAGFRAGDVILEVGGEDVTTPREVTDAIGRIDTHQFAVTIMRDRQQRELTVTIPDTPRQERRESFRFMAPSRTVTPFRLPGSTISH